MEETTVPGPEEATAETEAPPEPEQEPKPQKVISFARGVPAPECLPVEELADCAEAVLKDDGRTILSYGSAAGYMPLREHIAQWHGVDPARVVITNGALQGFVLFARRVARGSRVLIEEPTYDRAIKILTESGATLGTVLLDDEGITPESLEDVMRTSEQVAFLYTIPTFQNPSGRTMSAERRRRIVELARFYNLQVVEDDPYGLVRYEGEPEPSLFELSDRTFVYSSSFSKTISPACASAGTSFPRSSRPSSPRTRPRPTSHRCC
jgi:DNA-binding transcriptional MocR family regulator